MVSETYLCSFNYIGDNVMCSLGTAQEIVWCVLATIFTMLDTICGIVVDPMFIMLQALRCVLAPIFTVGDIVMGSRHRFY